MAQSLANVMEDIVDSISRKKGSFGVADNPDPKLAGSQAPFALAVGSWRTVNVNGGFVVVLGLTREQLTKLRNSCDELLGRASA